MRWLRRIFERHRPINRLVPWTHCAWSPQKAAEKRFAQMLFENRMALAKIRIDAARVELEQWMKTLLQWKP